MTTDNLSFARGLINALAISAVMWLVIGITAYCVFGG
jgi:hypothetical protein